MPTIEFSTTVAAPRDRCFDLARSVELHLRSAARTDEEATAGRRSGLLALGDEVTWRASHLGRRRELTVRISAYDRPFHFRDSQVRGDFAWFDHDHWFDPGPAGTTIMRERFEFAAPWGPLGVLVAHLVVGPHLRRFLRARAEVIREVAESGEWGRFLSETHSAAGA